MTRVDPRMKENYGYFKLELKEKEEYERQHSPTRYVKNPDDPFYKRPVFRKNHLSVYNTNKILSFIKPFQHDDLLNKSKDQIASTQRRLMNKYLDREQVYYSPNPADSKSITSEPRQDSSHVLMARNENDA
jgi:hypothetical protein